MVLIGAGTLRAENVNFALPMELHEIRAARGLSPVPLAAVLSPSAQLPLDRTFFTSGEFPSVVFTTENARSENKEALKPYAQVVVVGENDVDLSDLMSILTTDFGVKRLVVEGGPSLNASMIRAGFANELFWTVAPKMIGGRELSMVQTPDLLSDLGVPLQLSSAYAIGNEVYLRYRF
jgi:riboflavin biosynthesis pyrimidine reductase